MPMTLNELWLREFQAAEILSAAAILQISFYSSIQQNIRLCARKICYLYLSFLRLEPLGKGIDSAKLRSMYVIVRRVKL